MFDSALRITHPYRRNTSDCVDLQTDLAQKGCNFSLLSCGTAGLAVRRTMFRSLLSVIARH
jgi:hypothetical protein